MTNFRLTPETTAGSLYWHAVVILNGPLPGGPLLNAFVERAGGEVLYYYARDVLKGPLPEGPLLEAFRERADGYILYWYARDVLEGPLPLGPLLDAFRERADAFYLGLHTKRFGPLPPPRPKDPYKAPWT